MQGRIFASYNGKKSEPALPILCLNLLTEQEYLWPALSEGIAALDEIRIRDLHCSGFSVKLQFNPARIISSAAPLDPQSIKERPCFLCTKNLPAAQKGILYRQKFLILCNPFPIVRRHYTVSHINHMPQSLSEAIHFLLNLSKDLSPDFNVFYNGPCAGASAPDHLHFQAAPSGTLPVEKEIRDNRTRWTKTSMDGIFLSNAGLSGREALVMEGKTATGVETALLKVMDRLKHAIPTAEEPLMNLLCSYQENTWQLIIFLRRKHRPHVYYLTGKKRILISPGLMDMGGLVITPIEKDFILLDAETMENIYREVSLDSETVQKVVASQ
jgi:hypothetical protein